MANLRFNIRPVIIQGDDLSRVESADDNVMIEYNNYYPAGRHVSTYRIEAQLDLANVTVHDDLSISFDYGGIKAVRAHTTSSSSAVGYSIDKTLHRGDGSTAWHLNSDIATAFDSGWQTVATRARQHYVVPPNGSISITEEKAFRWLSRAVVSDECEVFVGGTVTNIIPTYKPNGLRKNGEWKSVQGLKLSTYIRTSNSWSDVGTEQVATMGQAGKGQTRRRQSGQWKQEGKFATD